MYEKRPTYMEKDLHAYEKRPTYMKRDLHI